MRPLRLALLAIALPSVALAASPSDRPSAADAPRAGLSYGALTPQGYALWIRLRPDRRRVANLEMSWEAPAARCSNRRTFYSFSSLGGENEFVIPVRGGQFTKHVTERYFQGGTAIVEDVRIQGRITATESLGQFSVKVSARRRDGTGFKCNLGPVVFRAVN